jgi:PAS domain S-box-containing protein
MFRPHDGYIAQNVDHSLDAPLSATGGHVTTHDSSDTADLRNRAEELARESPLSHSLSPEETGHMLHDLNVHQIELELQNEELRRTQAELEAERARYFDFYDLAPVGYCTLSEKGLILELNLTAANLLGAARGALVTQPIFGFILKEYQDVFYLFRRRLFEISEPQTCDLRLLKTDGTTFWAHLEATAALSGDGARTCRVVLNDITERKEAEETLRRSEEKHRLLFETMAQGVVYQAADGGITSANPAAERILGLSLDQMLGRTSSDPNWVATHEDGSDFPGDQHPAMVALRTGEPVCGVIMGVRNSVDGEPRWITIDATPRLIPGETAPNGVYTTFTDITERRRAEANYQTLFREMLDGFAVHEIVCDEWGDPVDYRFLAVNPAFESIIGLKAEDVVGRTVLAAFPGTERHWIETYGRVALTGEPAFFENYHAGLNMHFQVTAFRPAANQFACIFTDITERKRAEYALRESEEKHRLLFESASDAIFIHDEKERMLAVNPPTAERLGYTHAELMSMTVGQVDTPEEAQHAPKRIARLMAEGHLTFETVHQRKDGSLVPTEVSGRQITWDGQSAILSICRDISDRKQAEQERLVLERQLQQSQKLESLGVLAGGIAHDFNNILTSVLGNADLALIELSPSAPARENLLEITAGCRRAAALCRQMLAYSGRGHFVIKPIDLGAFITDMLGLLGSVISKKALLTLQLEENLPLLEGDPSQLSQVIMNLVLNASEALGETEGTITISTGSRECSGELPKDTYQKENLAPGRYLTLEVSDTGCGMDAETQERMFEPFFTTKFTGRGLGLAAVQGIVRGHRGALRLFSEPGRGTTFTILFPATAGDPALPVRKTGAATAGWRGEGTVLLVDDEESVRALGARMLSSLGFTVLAAADGRQALEVYAEHRDEITLVLLDLTMPHLDGEETFRELRRLDPGVRVLMSSGYAESDITARFAGQGPLGFVQKPYTRAELRERLRAALGD